MAGSIARSAQERPHSPAVSRTAIKGVPLPLPQMLFYKMNGIVLELVGPKAHALLTSLYR
jgi:hypothetical protein